jgi:hypothetical protein
MAVFAAQDTDLRDALRLGRSQDEAVYTALANGYNLTVSGPITNAEVITEFRRAVMIARDRLRTGDVSLTEYDLAQAMKPYANTVGFVVQVKLPPLNTYTSVPAYDLYVASGPGTPPIAATKVRRTPVYLMGAADGPLVGVRIEVTMPRDAVAGARAPELVVTNDAADVLWRVRIDLSRFR